MKRSPEVAVPLLAATALALLTGCQQQPEPQRCVDEQNHVVATSFCANQPQNLTGNQQNGLRPGLPLFLPYRYYYGGSGGFSPGSLVSGGSSTPLSGHSYSTSRTPRGGFGSTFSGGQGGEGGSGGGGE